MVAHLIAFINTEELLNITNKINDNSMKDTTKKSIADEFCRTYTEFHGELIDNPKQITSHTFTGEELMEFCQFYASQFVKKDSVSSDVEQALANISHYVAGENVDPKFNELTISVVEYNEAISVIRKWQSTQQPATINFFSDEEIRKMFGDGKDKEAGLFCEAMVAACHTIQSKLKERVNCVDEDKTKCSNEGCQLPASCGGKCGAHCDCLA